LKEACRNAESEKDSPKATSAAPPPSKHINFLHLRYSHCFSFYKTVKMIARTFLLLCVLAASSYAFAVQQPAPFAARTTALKMTGGDALPPPVDLKVRTVHCHNKRMSRLVKMNDMVEFSNQCFISFSHSIMLVPPSFCFESQQRRQQQQLQPPAALYQGAVAAGAAKAAAPFGKIFKLGIVAGCHIAFGAYLAITVGGACPGIAQTNPGLQKVSRDQYSLFVLYHNKCLIIMQSCRLFWEHLDFRLDSS
jgi:hypothetical protein